MADTSTLASAIESAFDGRDASGTDAGNQTTDNGSASSANPTASSSPTGLVGSTDQRPAQGTGDQQTADASFALSLPPDTVIATGPDGKPITAGEFQSGYLRQSDYTRKTQEIAEYRRQAEPALQFMEANRDVLESLGSGDPERIAETLRFMADAYGVSLEPQTSGPSRSPDGRFAKASAAPGTIDLDQYEEGSEAHALASVINQMAEQNQRTQARLDQFLGSVEQQVRAQEHEAQMSAVASEWAKQGFNADPGGASALIGQPITPDQAMLLHHFEGIMRHNIAFAQQSGSAGRPVPNEPGGTQGNRPGIDPTGMPLDKFMEQRLTGGR